jgi:hypothetical protein
MSGRIMTCVWKPTSHYRQVESTKLSIEFEIRDDIERRFTSPARKLYFPRLRR